MENIQQNVAESLETIARQVREGRYGQDNDFDNIAFEEDLENAVIY